MGEIRELRKEMLDLQNILIKFRVELNELINTHANELMRRADTLLPEVANERGGETTIARVRHSKSPATPNAVVRAARPICPVCGKEIIRRHRHNK